MLVVTGRTDLGCEGIMGLCDEGWVKDMRSHPRTQKLTSLMQKYPITLIINTFTYISNYSKTNC